MHQRRLLLLLLGKKEATYAFCIRISFNEHRYNIFTRENIQLRSSREMVSQGSVIGGLSLHNDCRHL
jgi:hypothetical protein